MINKKEENKIEVLRRKENKDILIDVPISMILKLSVSGVTYAIPDKKSMWVVLRTRYLDTEDFLLCSEIR